MLICPSPWNDEYFAVFLRPLNDEGLFNVASHEYDSNELLKNIGSAFFPVARIICVMFIGKLGRSLLGCTPDQQMPTGI